MLSNQPLRLRFRTSAVLNICVEAGRGVNIANLLNDDDRTVQQTYSSSEKMSALCLVHKKINLRLNQELCKKPLVFRKYSTGKQKTSKTNW
jgi:hypothetical protein